MGSVSRQPGNLEKTVALYTVNVCRNRQATPFRKGMFADREKKQKGYQKKMEKEATGFPGSLSRQNIHGAASIMIGNIE